DREPRDRAEVPDAVDFREPARAREPGALAGPTQQGRRGHPAVAAVRRAADPHRGDARQHRPGRPRAGAGGGPGPRGEAGARGWGDARSQGEREWCGMGRVVGRRGGLLVLEEPVAGMTDEETARTAEL